MKLCAKCLLSALVCVLLCGLQATAQEGTESDGIMVDGAGGVFARVGCSEELRCVGEGTGIGWRLFGIRENLKNTSSYYIVTESMPLAEDPSGPLSIWTSRLIFPSLSAMDAGGYSCVIFHDTPTENRVPQVVTVQLSVSPELVAIEPPIVAKDIDTYYVGDTLLVGCPVQTCATGITVQFLRNDSIVAEGRPSSTDERVYTMNLPMGLDSAGEYVCRVTTESPGGLALHTFNVTGTPLVRPTLSPTTPPQQPGGTTQPGSTAQTTTDSGMTRNTPFSLTLLLVLAGLLCAYRL